MSVLALSAFEPRWASAQSSPLSLTWVAPEGCPQQEAARAAVLRLAGVTNPIRTLVARVTVVADSKDFELTLATEVDGIVGERVLRGRSCRTVTDAAVVMMALILNPEVERHPPESTPPPAPPAPSLPASYATASAKSSPATPSRTHAAHAFLGTQFGLAVGALPHPGPEFGVGVGAALGPASLWLLGSYVGPPQKATAQGQTQAGGHLWDLSVAAVGCGSTPSKPVGIGVCLGAEFDRVEGHGVGVSDPHAGVIYWFSPTLGVFGELRLTGAVALRLSAFGMLRPVRPTLFLDAIGPVYRPPQVAAKGHLGVVATLF